MSRLDWQRPHRQQTAERVIPARKAGVCRACEERIWVGQKIANRDGSWVHVDCSASWIHRAERKDKPREKPATDIPWLALLNPWRSPELAQILEYELP